MKPRSIIPAIVFAAVLVMAFGGSFTTGKLGIGGEPATALQVDTGFSDVDPSSVHAESIAKLSRLAITAGCSATESLYCPDAPVTRAQMASFIARSFSSPTPTFDYFSDDTGNTHETNINSIAAVAITGGCELGKYCPSAAVTRAQMASFIARTLQLPAASSDRFPDDNGNTHEANINALAEAGITQGCTADSFCPSDSITRAQMASFIARALDWLGCEFPEEA